MRSAFVPDVVIQYFEFLWLSFWFWVFFPSVCVFVCMYVFWHSFINLIVHLSH